MFNWNVYLATTAPGQNGSFCLFLEVGRNKTINTFPGLFYEKVLGLIIKAVYFT